MQGTTDEISAASGACDPAHGIQDGRRIHYGVWMLLVGTLTIFGCLGLGRFAIGMIIPQMGSGLNLTNTQLGLIVSGTFFGYLASILTAGNLATRLGPKRVIATSMALISAGMVVTGSAHGFAQALIGQLLIGVGSGGSNVPTVGLITRWYAKRLRGLATGIMAAGSGFGFALAGMFTPFLIRFYGAAGWRASWFLIGGVVAAIAVLGVIVFRNDPAEAGTTPVGSGREAEERPLLSGKAGGDDEVCPADIYRSRALWELGVIYFMFGFSYVAFTTFFAKYLIEEMGFSQAAAGQLWTAIGLASILSGFTWGMLSDRIGRKNALFIVYTLQGLCLLALAFGGTPGVVTIASIIYALTLWSIPAIMSAACADYVGGVLAPSALGMITLFFGIGQVMNPWISGYIIDATQHFAIPFMVAAGASVIGAVLSVALPERG